MTIKVVALDIYGTVLASDDYDSVAIPRNGLEKFFERCSSKKIRVVSASDSTQASSDIALVANHHNLPWLVGGFSDHYTLDEYPKDFSRVSIGENVSPRDLLVIGDNYMNKDLRGAEAIGAPFVFVPEYLVSGKDDFSFDQIDLDLGKRVRPKK